MFCLQLSTAPGGDDPLAVEERGPAVGQHSLRGGDLQDPRVLVVKHFLPVDHAPDADFVRIHPHVGRIVVALPAI